MDGIHLINSLKSFANIARLSCDVYHNKWYTEAVELANRLDIKQETPRTVGRQYYRNNVPAETPSEYFKRAVTIPILDHLKSELENRFDLNSLSCYKGASIIPTKIAQLKNKNINWKCEFKEFANLYLNDLPSPYLLDHELDLWEIYWDSFQETKPSNITKTMKLVEFTGFENIKVALQILATLPLTSNECERSFSSMKLLKTFSRSTMSAERLNGLSLMYKHQQIIPKTSEILNKFGLKNRRLDFSKR
jgi:hypothetical protein